MRMSEEEIRSKSKEELRRTNKKEYQYFYGTTKRDRFCENTKAILMCIGLLMGMGIIFEIFGYTLDVIVVFICSLLGVSGSTLFAIVFFTALIGFFLFLLVIQPLYFHFTKGEIKNDINEYNATR